MAKNIVARLRFAFIFVMFVFTAGFILNSNQLYNLYITQKNTIDVSIPSLSRSHRVEVQLRALTNAIPALKAAENTEKSKLIDQDIKASIQLVRELLAQDRNDSAQSLNNQLLAQLGQLAGQLESLVPLKLELLSIDSRLAELSQELLAYRQQIRNIVEPLRFDLLYSLDTQISALQSGLATTSGDSSADLDVNALSVINDISSQADSIIDLGDYLSGILPEDAQRPVETRIQYLLRTVTLSLVYIKTATARESLVPLVKNLYVLILGDDGILHQVNNRRVALNAFTSAELNIQQLTDGISFWTNDHVDKALLDFDLSARDFRKHLSLMLLISVVSGVVITLIVILVSQLVVERQINRRVQRLTDSVLKIADNQTDHVVGIQGDDEIATIAKALEIFRQNTIDLQRSNSELREFAYAASHDLKSPLRAIENLAQWIREDAHEFLPPDSRENLDLLQARVARLSSLQSDLLLYSQAGTGKQHYEKLDLEKMIKEFRELLDPENHFKITSSGGIPVIYTYLVPLKQVVMNLVNNAIKHHDRTEGQITVHASISNSTLHIAVSDDGAGIDPRYHQTIFKLFKTLKSQDEVEGSGLGLSMVRKIVNRHGGSISVRSNPVTGRGADFLVVWPVVSFTSMAA